MRSYPFIRFSIQPRLSLFMKKKVVPRPPATQTPQLPRLVPRRDLPEIHSASLSSLIPKTGHWSDTILFALFLLTLLTPLIYSSTTFFGFITGRTIYFRVLVALMVLTALTNRRMLASPLTGLQVSVLLFGLALALANALGVDPVNSFLSGYARMEGFLAYGHYGLYFLVLARAGFSKQRWRTGLTVSVIVSVLVVLYGASQASGWQTDHYRLIATIGNASYLGLYLLLHLFLAVYLFWQFPAMSRWLRWMVVTVVTGVLLWGLVMSGTRSAVLGLGAGIAVLGTGWAIVRLGWSKRMLPIGLGILILLGGMLVGLRDTSFVKNVPYLQRLTSVSGSDNTFRPRFLNWRMALTGITDRPVLGWGQENYGYGFAQHYDPALLLEGTETYDRAHNLLLDIGFSAGLVGLLAYGFIWFCLLRRLRKNPLFTPTDRVVLLALLVAYLVFNALNFDSLVSAQVFFLVLALLDTAPTTDTIRTRQSTPVAQWAIRAVAGISVLMLGYYTLNSWQTLRQIARQNQMPTAQSRAETIETAYRQARVGQLEIADVLVSLATSVLPSPEVPAPDKQFCYDRAVSALMGERRKHPDNTRLITRLAGLYATNKELNRASVLYDTLLQTDAQWQPRLWFQAGKVNLENQQPEKARQQFREAYRRQSAWQLPLLYEALTHAVTGDTSQTRALVQRVTTATLIENFALVKQTYLMNRDLTGLLTRLDRVPYADRSLYMDVSLYQDWALLAFEAGRSDQVSSALRSFQYDYTDMVDVPAIEQMIVQAGRGVRPEGIQQYMK